MGKATDRDHRTLTGSFPVGVACAVFALASCGGDDTSTPPADHCASFAGAYGVTTEVVATDCSLGLHAITQPITWTFVQTAPSCRFTRTNSLYPASQYAGYFTMQGDRASVTWTSVSPAPTVAGRALTYTSENLTVTPAAGTASATLSGSFAWSSAAACAGTTNVCHGSVAAGCPTPN